MKELLATKLRPKTLNDVIGQSHLIGDGKILTNLINNGIMYSFILYGDPGIGKTSIATIIAKELNIQYRCLNAVINNKKDFDIVFEEAKLYDNFILIVDEIHRLNKAMQDILLPHLEDGRIILIGMTTTNPYHSINPAIRSRLHLFKLNSLTKEDIVYGLNKAIKSNILPNINIGKDTINYIASISMPDIRYAYNLLELSYYTSDNGNITTSIVKSINNKPNLLNDKDGDNYYNLLSAFQKSIRGSDVNASIYYLARLILSGDIESICRRLSVIVYEDIGLANPSLSLKVSFAIDSALKVGLPEARIILSEIVIEMALSAKSNSAKLAIDRALECINNGDNYHIPSHLINNNPEYKYPHNYPNHIVSQQYLPDKIKYKEFYIPSNNKNEMVYKSIMDNLKKIINN